MYGIVFAKLINEECYLKGKIEEQENLFFEEINGFQYTQRKTNCFSLKG
jgi:TfoX/Sxy family transcriptional regulator of competence genes